MRLSTIHNPQIILVYWCLKQHTPAKLEINLSFYHVLWFSASLNLIDIKCPFNLCPTIRFHATVAFISLSSLDNNNDDDVDGDGDGDIDIGRQKKREYHQIIWRNKNITIIYFYGFINHSSAIIYHSYYYDLTCLLRENKFCTFLVYSSVILSLQADLSCSLRHREVGSIESRTSQALNKNKMNFIFFPLYRTDWHYGVVSTVCASSFCLSAHIEALHDELSDCVRLYYSLPESSTFSYLLEIICETPTHVTR